MQPVEGICSWVNAALLAAQWHRELQLLLAYYFTSKLVAERYQTKLTSSKRRQLMLFWTPTAVTQVICEDQKTATAAVELCRQKKPCRHFRLQHLVMLQGRQGRADIDLPRQASDRRGFASWDEDGHFRGTTWQTSGSLPPG